MFSLTLSPSHPPYSSLTVVRNIFGIWIRFMVVFTLYRPGGRPTTRYFRRPKSIAACGVSTAHTMSMSTYKPAHIHLGDFGGDWGVYCVMTMAPVTAPSQADIVSGLITTWA